MNERVQNLTDDPPPTVTVDQLHRLDVGDFKRAIASLWEQAGCDTTVTDGNRGADVLAIKPDSKTGADIRRYAIRAINRRRGDPVEASTLRAFQVRDDPHVTDVVLTTGRFTELAASYATARSIALIDGEDLTEIARSADVQPLLEPAIPEAAEPPTVERATAGEPSPEPPVRNATGGARPEATSSRLISIALLPTRILEQILGRPLFGTRSSYRFIRWGARLGWTIVVLFLLGALLLNVLTSGALVLEFVLGTDSGVNLERLLRDSLFLLGIVV